MSELDDLKSELNDLKLQVGENTTKIKTFSSEIRRLRKHRDDLFERLDKGEKNYEIINFQLKQITESLYELKAELKILKEKPTKTFDFIVMGILSVIVSGIGMFIINKILNS